MADAAADVTGSGYRPVWSSNHDNYHRSHRHRHYRARMDILTDGGF